jgi:alpha-tubulin suppressor-like RCC1 family protein
MPNQFLSPEGDLENYFVTEYWLIDQYVGDTLWTWGRNDLGQLAINTAGGTTNRTTPVTTSAGGVNWKQVSAGYKNTTAIKTDGTLWTWGYNFNGQLGINNTSQILVCTPVTTFTGGTNWQQVSISATAPFIAAIKTDGTLWTWGFNTNGQLGINASGTTTQRTTPTTTFAGGTNWKQVACGLANMAAIKTDGTLWTWGNNGGQLGDNATTDRSTPVTTFAGGNNWKQVSCGSGFIAAIKTDGTLWTWGGNASGQLGDNTGTTRSTPVTTFAGGTNWKQVSCGSGFIAAIKTDGTLWTWGDNANSQLGNSNLGNRSTPVTTYAGGTNWKQVSCGTNHTAAIKTNGTLWTWGLNTYGQLGDNTTSNPGIPITTYAGGSNWKQVSAGDSHTLAVTSGTDPTFFIS